jgi:titin
MLAVNGLSATYFNNADLTGSTVQRIDPTINFNWMAGSPSPAIAPDTFSARWTGQVSSETSGLYTFYTRSNDGARLWVNNVLLVNTWNAGTFAEGQGNIELVAGTNYDIKMEFTEDTGNALAQLQWSGPGVTKRVVPTSRLTTEGEPTATRPPAPTGLTAKATGPKRVELSWTDVAGETSYRVERRLDGTTTWAPVGTTPANVTTFADETVQPGKKYFYRVRAFNGTLGSEPSNVADATTPLVEPGTPAAPTELHIVEIGIKFVRLAWNDVAGESGYKIERRIDGSTEWKQIGTTDANITTFRDEDPALQFGKTYIYRVRANNAELNSPYSNPVAAKIPGGDVKPVAPRELRVTGVTATSVSLAWLNVPYETGYEIQRRLDGSSPDSFAKIGETAANVTTFTDTNVEAGKTYIYRVIAFNNIGRSDPSNTAFATIPGGPVRPARPTELHVTSITRTSVSLAWNDVAGEKGYEIQRRLDGSPDGFAKIGETGENVTTFTDNNVENTKTYIYRVIAFNDVGRSEPSNNAAATIPAAEGAPARPTELHVTSASASAISLAWNNVANELGYEIYRRVAESGSFLTSVGEVGADVLTFTDATVETGHQYIYVVQAFNAAGVSFYSNPAGATV